MIILWVLTAAAFLFVLFTLIMGAKNMGGKTEDARAQSNIWMPAAWLAKPPPSGFCS